MQDGELEDILRRFPLPEGVEDMEVNRKTLAKALNVSENTISKYQDAGMPVLEAGTNGKDYKFQLSECYAWRMARDADDQARRALETANADQLALAFRNPDEDASEETVGLTARQIADESDAEIKRLRAAEARRDLVNANRMRVLLEDLLVQCRDSIMTMVDFCELEFSLSPDQVAKLQARCVDQLRGMRGAIEREIILPKGDLVAMKEKQAKDA